MFESDDIRAEKIIEKRGFQQVSIPALSTNS
jgi:hypothetical protein